MIRSSGSGGTDLFLFLPHCFRIPQQPQKALAEKADDKMRKIAYDY